MKTVFHFYITMLDGDEYIFEENEEAARAKFEELYREDKSKIEQFYSKEWFKVPLTEEEKEDGYEVEWEEGEVEVFFEEGDEYPLFSPIIIEADLEMDSILEKYPNFSVTGSVEGMRNLYYGYDAFLVRCGDYIYNVPEDIYNKINE